MICVNPRDPPNHTILFEPPMTEPLLKLAYVKKDIYCSSWLWAQLDLGTLTISSNCFFHLAGKKDPSSPHVILRVVVPEEKRVPSLIGGEEGGGREGGGRGEKEGLGKSVIGFALIHLGPEASYCKNTRTNHFG